MSNLGKIVFCVTAAAGVARAAPVYSVPTTVEHFKHARGKFEKDVTFFSVRLPSPVAEARINLAIRQHADVDSLPPRARGHDRGVCTVDVATTQLVAWTCTSDYQSSDLPEGSGGSGPVVGSQAYLIDGAEIRSLKAEDLFEDPRAVAEKLSLTDLGCDGVIVTAGGGVAFSCTDAGMDPKAFEYSKIKALLKPGNPLTALQGAKPAPRSLLESRDPAGARYASQADGVLDRSTGLIWSAADNGADLSWDEASTLAQAKPGWRLPTLKELGQLWDRAARHKATGDCSGGKHFYEISSALSLTCGLVWSSDTDDPDAAAFGFVTGSPRWTKKTAKEHMRVLLVKKT